MTYSNLTLFILRSFYMQIILLLLSVMLIVLYCKLSLINFVFIAVIAMTIIAYLKSQHIFLFVNQHHEYKCFVYIYNSLKRQDIAKHLNVYTLIVSYNGISC